MQLDPKYKSIIEIGVLLGTAVFMAIVVSSGITFLLGSPKHPTVAVTTTSMLPIYNGFEESSTIQPFQGDILLVKKVQVESIDLGDVIIFDTPYIPEPVVHRVVAKWSQDGSYYFRTNGDNNERPDHWIVSGDNIHGVVVSRIPHIGWFLLVVQTTIGRLIILLLAVLVLFIGGDSEEEEEEGETEEINETNSISEENNNLKNQPNFTAKASGIRSKIIKFVQERSNVYVLIGLIIIVLFLASNLLSAIIFPPSVRLYSFSDESRTLNLLESPVDSPFSLSLPASYRDRFHWYESENGTEETFFFPIQIEVSSGGIFNNIDRVEISTNGIHENGTQGLYRWTIVYDFIGKRYVREGGIILFADSEGPYTVMISLTMYSRGLLRSSPTTFNFPLLLNALH